LVLACLLALAAGGAGARTPDGQPPSQETVCDNETGAAFGLCNAYCEAMDCDSPNHHASDNACAAVKRNFERKTGRPLPCEMTCPCPEHLPVYAAIVAGTEPILRCVATPEFVIVQQVDLDFSTVTTAPPECHDNVQPPFVPLTPQEQQVCRVQLITAAESRGVPCLPPE
jgi:hypothetical protein